MKFRVKVLNKLKDVKPKKEKSIKKLTTGTQYIYTRPKKGCVG